MSERADKKPITLWDDPRYLAGAEHLIRLNPCGAGRQTCREVVCGSVPCKSCPLTPMNGLGSKERLTYSTLGEVRGVVDRIHQVRTAIDPTTEPEVPESVITGATVEPKVTESKPTVASDVHQPSHYKLFQDVESIEVIARSMTIEQFHGFCFGNILKYRLRAGKKSELATMEKDLAKASFYETLFEHHKGKCHA